MAKSTSSSWAVPTQNIINRVYKNTTSFGQVKSVKKAPFNPGKYERAKKKAFGM